MDSHASWGMTGIEIEHVVKSVRRALAQMGNPFIKKDNFVVTLLVMTAISSNR